jgi:hypothetical protein
MHTIPLPTDSFKKQKKKEKQKHAHAHPLDLTDTVLEITKGHTTIRWAGPDTTRHAFSLQTLLA